MNASEKTGLKKHRIEKNTEILINIVKAKSNQLKTKSNHMEKYD
jgi:hypothetical protein